MLAVALLMLLAPAAPLGAGRSDGTGYPLSCSYIARGELENADRCAASAAGTFHITTEVVAKLSYDHGLASIAIHGRGWFYRRRDGRMVEMLTFDNGPDFFAEGLARAKIDGRLVYVDRRLRIRIPTRYSFAEPFRHGRAAMCIGCISVPVDRGEHHAMRGGLWGIIDRRGREIVPPTLTQSDFEQQRARLTGP